MNGFKLWLLIILFSMFASNVLSQMVPIKAPIHANGAQNLGSPISLFFDFGIGKAPGLFKGNGTFAEFFLYFSKRNNIISFRTLGNMEYIF